MTEEQDRPMPLNNEAGPKLWGRYTLASIIITAALLVLLVSYVDLAQVWRELIASNKGFLVLAALSHYGTYPVRGVRWKRSLSHVPVRCGNARFGLLVFFYNFVDNVVPARLGDVYAAHLARVNCGVRRSAALGSIVFLRMVDALLVLTIIIWGMEVLWVFLLAMAFHVNLKAGQAVFLTMIPIIVTAFPLTPSGAGAVELTLFGCLRLVGVATPLAASLTVVNRFIDFWLHIILGTLTWMFRSAFGLRTWKDRPAITDEPALTTPPVKELAP